MRTICLWLIVVFVICISGVSLNSSAEEIGHAETPGQWLVMISTIVHGIAGFALVAALWRRAVWVTPIALVWAIGLILAAGVAPVAYGETSWKIGVLSGFVVSLIAGGIVAFFHRTRGRLRGASLK